MFKSFLGYDLYQKKSQKHQEKREGRTIFDRTFRVLFAIIVGLVVWNLPGGTFGLEGLTLTEQRVIAVFCSQLSCGFLKVSHHGVRQSPLSCCCCSRPVTVLSLHSKRTTSIRTWVHSFQAGKSWHVLRTQ